MHSVTKTFEFNLQQLAASCHTLTNFLFIIDQIKWEKRRLCLFSIMLYISLDLMFTPIKFYAFKTLENIWKNQDYIWKLYLELIIITKIKFINESANSSLARVYLRKKKTTDDHHASWNLTTSMFIKFYMLISWRINMMLQFLMGYDRLKFATTNDHHHVKI